MIESFGKRVRETRKARGMSMRELARCVGMSHVAIQRIEHSTRGPRLQTAVAIAYVLGVSIDELAYDTSPINPLED